MINDQKNMFSNSSFIDNFLSLVIFITPILLVDSAAAQEAEGCFMVNGAGDAINLTALCGSTTKEAPIQLIQPKVFQAKIKRRQGGTPVIDVTFNGKQKFEMLLDTGASQTTITPPMASLLGVVLLGTQTAHVASGEAIEFPIARVASMEVGGAAINNATVLIAPIPLLGQNFFGTYNITIKQDVVEFQPTFRTNP